MLIWILILFLLAIFAVLIAKFCLIIVAQSTVGIIERLGSFHKVADNGINFIMPFTDKLVKIIDMKEQIRDFPPLPVITRDNVTMLINTIVYYQITDPVKVEYEISDIESAIENLTATTLRNIIGELELDETLNSRDIINGKLRSILDEATDKWGVRVSRVELKDISPPEDIKDAMETQMKAEREKRAQILIAEGKREAAIREAEGEREAAIARAEGEKIASILKAEGEAESIRAVESAKADMVKKVFHAIHEGQADEKVIALQYFETLKNIADGQASKIYMPLEWGKILANFSNFFDLKEK